MSVDGTLGVEEELHIFHPRTGQLVPSAARLLRQLPGSAFGAELQRSTVEINSPATTSLSDLNEEMIRLRRQLRDVAQGFGLEVGSVGMAPGATDNDFELTVRGRYSRMHDEYRLLVDEQLICGYQVHVGVEDRDLAARLTSRVEDTLPILLALSASSPFWQGRDTGYASMRTMIWERWPTSGSAGRFESIEEYERMVRALVGTGVISDAKMAYFDVRPSDHVPTLELRVCDACPLVDEAVLIAGLFRAAVFRAAQADEAGDPLPRRAPPVQRTAMWRAARSGLSGDLLGLGPEPEPLPAAQAVDELLVALRPQLEGSDDWETVRDLAHATLARGCSAARQRARYAERGRMIDVVQLVIDETANVAAERPKAFRWTSNYPASTGDEAITGGAPNAGYRRVFEVLDGMTTTDMKRRAERVSEISAGQGLTFGVGGRQQTFGVDLVPRIIAAHQWSTLVAGLTQRARAIEAFLQDVYGPAHVVADGVLESSDIETKPGWRKEGRAIPPGVVRAAVYGFDLVRDPVAGWRVLEDNVRVPSGVGYAIGTRRVLDAVVPELAEGVDMHEPEEVYSLVSRTLRACARADVDEPVVALLSTGATNSAWYEHQVLADGADLLLCEPKDIEFRTGRPTLNGRPLDVIYLRIDGELVDLVDDTGRPIGAGILEAARRHMVVVVNAPGNGVADDKSMYCHIPDIITYYLAESPLLPSVPTYRCADATELEIVLDRLGELVTKPVDGYGGGGVLVGAEAGPAELEERRRQLRAEPERWVAQETVALSTLPTMAGDRLEPRCVDLRTFVYLSGTGQHQAEVAGLGLTRVAPSGSMIVNSSRGGGAKDTWILIDTDPEQ